MRLKFMKVRMSAPLACRLSGNKVCAMVIPLLHQARNKLQKERAKHHKGLRIKPEKPAVLTLQLYPRLPGNYQQENSWLPLTHVESDDDSDSDEAVITTSCDNLDCKALLLENKSLKDKLQNRLDILQVKVKFNRGHQY